MEGRRPPSACQSSSLEAGVAAVVRRVETGARRFPIVAAAVDSCWGRTAEAVGADWGAAAEAAVELAEASAAREVAEASVAMMAGAAGVEGKTATGGQRPTTKPVVGATEEARAAEAAMVEAEAEAEARV